MISVLEHIEYLVMRQDYVVVPGWGAFIAQYDSSGCSKNGEEWHSPERQISFNSDLSYSDGTLANSIMRKESCSYAIATEAIRDNVDTYKRQLEDERELPFGGIGMFRLENGKVEFVPYSGKNNAANEFYGLGHFSMKPLSCINDKGDEDALSINAWKFSINKSYLKIAASILVLLVLSFVLSTPIPNKLGTQDFASISSIRFPDDMAMPMLSDTRELAITLPVASKDSVIVKAYKSMGGAAPEAEEEDRYFLVVCSALSQKEADMFIAQQRKNYDYKVLARKGRYRVYVAAGNSIKELMGLKYNISADYPDAWVHYSR